MTRLHVIIINNLKDSDLVRRRRRRHVVHHKYKHLAVNPDYKQVKVKFFGSKKNPAGETN